jgi:hypothetical protein
VRENLGELQKANISLEFLSTLLYVTLPSTKQMCCTTILKRMFILFVCLMVFNATFYFNNISAISRRSVLLVDETGGLRENHLPVTSH